MRTVLVTFDANTLTDWESRSPPRIKPRIKPCCLMNVVLLGSRVEPLMRSLGYSPEFLTLLWLIRKSRLKSWTTMSMSCNWAGLVKRSIKRSSACSTNHSSNVSTDTSKVPFECSLNRFFWMCQQMFVRMCPLSIPLECSAQIFPSNNP